MYAVKMEKHYVLIFWCKHNSKQRAAQIQTDLEDTPLRFLGLPIIRKWRINTFEETEYLLSPFPFIDYMQTYILPYYF